MGGEGGEKDGDGNREPEEAVAGVLEGGEDDARELAAQGMDAQGAGGVGGEEAAEGASRRGIVAGDGSHRFVRHGCAIGKRD